MPPATTQTPSTLGYWNDFYADRRSAAVPTNPSAFARWVDETLDGPTSIAELGFGTARDSFWLADRGHSLVAYDGAESAVTNANAHAAEHGIEAGFRQLDLVDADAVGAAAEALLTEGGVDAVYARFLLHSLPEQGRTNVLAFAARALRPDGRVFLEFRTGNDAQAEHLFGDDHFRVYLDPVKVAAEIGELGGRVDRLEQGYGMAVYKSEDPHVARIVATWPQGS